MNDASDAKDAQISALGARAVELWQRRRLLMRNAWVLLILGPVAIVASTFRYGGVLGALRPAFTWFLFGLGIILLIAGMAFVVLSLRTRFMVEHINDKIVKIDPSQRIIDSIPEQIGRRLRAAIDERHQT